MTVRQSNEIQERLLQFAVRILHVVEALPATRAGKHIAGQLVRCGTSPAPNYAESLDAESKSDFIHKTKIVLKELRETDVWLRMIVMADLIKPMSRLHALILECDELIAIFVASVKTARRNMDKPSFVSRRSSISGPSA